MLLTTTLLGRCKSIAKINIAKGVDITLWDRWEIKKGISTLEDFVKYYKDKYQLEVSGICQDGRMVYMALMPGSAKKLPMKMRELLRHTEDQKYSDLVVSFTDADGKDVTEAPVIRFYHRKKSSSSSSSSSSKSDKHKSGGGKDGKDDKHKHKHKHKSSKDKAK